jgi:ADP-ribose pyrophosphatase YjhB (NUDIX family)
MIAACKPPAKRLHHTASMSVTNLVVAREISAGGVLVRRMRGRWHFAAIRPRGRGEVWALPKGLVDPGESAA